MEPRIQKAFEFASDSTKQLITLSTGIIALMISFKKDILTGISSGPRFLLMAAWFVYLLSVICGIWTLLALTGSLEPVVKNSQEVPPPTIRGKNVTFPAMIQVLTFLLATAMTVVFGAWATVLCK